MCDWNEGDPHCHLNPVNRFESCTQRKTSIVSSLLDIEHRSSCEVKNYLFGGTGGFCLDFTFHV